MSEKTPKAGEWWHYNGVLFASPKQVLASDEEILHDAGGFYVEVAE